MNRTEFQRQVKNYETILSDLQKQYNQIDKELPDHVQKKRKDAIWEKHALKAVELSDTVQAGKKHFQSVRTRATDPALSIFKAAYQRELKPQVAALLDSLDVFPAEKLVEICYQYKDPHLILRSQKIVQSTEFSDPQHKARLLDSIHELKKEFTDQAEARAAAESEFSAIQVQLQALELIEAAPEDKLTLGREWQAVKSILEPETDPEPMPGRHNFAADPTDRLKQGHNQ